MLIYSYIIYAIVTPDKENKIFKRFKYFYKNRQQASVKSMEIKLMLMKCKSQLDHISLLICY